MRLLLGLGQLIAFVLIAAAPTAARDASQIDGWDPFRPPVPDRIPDDYVKDRPYWRPPPGVQIHQIKSTKRRPSAEPQSTKARRVAPRSSPAANASSLSTASTIAPSRGSPSSQTKVAPSNDAMAAMAADKQLPVYDPYRPPIPDRPPDDFRD